MGRRRDGPVPCGGESVPFLNIEDRLTLRLRDEAGSLVEYPTEGPRPLVHAVDLPWSHRKLRETTVLHPGETYRHAIRIAEVLAEAPKGQPRSHIPIRPGRWTVKASARQ